MGLTHKRQDSTTNTSNRFCNCNALLCNCCREFNIPVVALKGPGCASLQYLKRRSPRHFYAIRRQGTDQHHHIK
ncbi:hypothetical protein NQ314_020719 [Rhamnusium bicolor]|uniref:DUF4773 domain-containing protein n=1 Tax=Rhamnusium bicolor TaxID=1586634 RepID=A0AAV8WKL4_9CUCU|nr:hypothetical protein NQ314_020719 [Rhamnusium bicolor]